MYLNLHLCSFELHYVNLHSLKKNRAKSLVNWFKPCSTAHEKTLAVRENENRADQATGSLYLNLSLSRVSMGVCLK